MDNAIKQEESHGRDLSHRKPLIVIECHNLRFSQQSIKEEFRDGSSLRGLINELAANPDHAYRIPPLRIFKSGAHFVSLDNRRLACLCQSSRFLGQALKVPCMLQNQRFILTRVSATHASKVRFYCTSTHRGASVQVRGAITRNGSRVIRVFKTTQSRLTVEPTSTQRRTKADPKTTRSHPSVTPKSIRNQLNAAPQPIRSRPKVDMITQSSIIGQGGGRPLVSHGVAFRLEGP